MRNTLRFLVSMLLVVVLIGTMVCASASSIKVLKCTVSGARLHSGPAGSYPTSSPSIKKGEKLFYLGTKNAFCQVRTEYGRVGYVYKPYLELLGSTDFDKVYVVSKDTKLYKNPKVGSYVTRLSKGRAIAVQITKGDWCYVTLLNGKTGFVPKAYLKKA